MHRDLFTERMVVYPAGAGTGYWRGWRKVERLMTKATREHEWEIELPASTAEQLLTALAARDRLFGQGITLEPEEDAANPVEVLLGSADELEGETFQLGIYAEIEGPEEYLDAAEEAIEDIVGEQLELSAVDAGQATLLDRRPQADLQVEAVGEEDERQSLILPGWLAPDDVELPWGFRMVDGNGQEWPAVDVLEAHPRLAVVPFEEEYLLYSLPEVPDEDGGRLDE